MCTVNAAIKKTMEYEKSIIGLCHTISMVSRTWAIEFSTDDKTAFGILCFAIMPIRVESVCGLFSNVSSNRTCWDDKRMAKITRHRLADQQALAVQWC